MRTLAELFAVLKQQLAGLPTDALVPVRKRLADELNKTLTADADGPLDAPHPGRRRQAVRPPRHRILEELK